MCDKIIVWSRSEYKIMTTNYLSWKELIRNFLRCVEASSTGVQIMSFHFVDSEWTSNNCVEMKKTHMRDYAHEVCRFMTSSSLWVLASTKGTATTTPLIKNLIGRVRKNNRAARVARTYEQVRAVLCKTTTWNYHIYRFDEYLSIQSLIFSSVIIAKTPYP